MNFLYIVGSGEPLGLRRVNAKSSLEKTVTPPLPGPPSTTDPPGYTDIETVSMSSKVSLPSSSNDGSRVPSGL